MQCLVYASTKNKPFLPGYYSIQDSKAKIRYKEKLDTIGGVDPYEILRNEPMNCN